MTKEYAKICEYCGQQFLTKYSRQKFCNPKCSMRSRENVKQTHEEKQARNELIYHDRLEGLSMNEIALKYGLNIGSVQHICKQYGVDGVLSSRKGTAHNKGIVKNEKDVAAYIERKFPHLQYNSGYKGCDQKLNVECKLCGFVFEVSATTLRGDKKLRCPVCRQAEAEQNAKERAKAAQDLKRKKAEAKAEKKKLDAIKKAKQIEFSVCKECGALFILTSKRVYCSKACSQKAVNNHKDRRIKADKIIDRDISLKKLYERDEGVCHICGGMCDFSSDPNGQTYPSIDHIKAVSQGGEHSWENIKLAHRGCNTQRWFAKQR